MTLQELDEVLRVWKGRLAAIAENLMELQADATYQSLTGTGGLAKAVVTGATAASLKPALASMHTMFVHFGLLQSTIDQAEKLRAGLPAFFGGEAKARELQLLLFGPSIVLTAAEDLPLQQRTLLAGPQDGQRVTPEQLLEPMPRSFAAARDAVMAVDRAWTEFGENCGRVEAEIARLQAQRALPSAVLAPSLDVVRAKLEAVRTHVQTDPLGAQGELRTEVEPLLAEVSRRVGMAGQLAQQARGSRVRWDEMVRVHAEAVRVVVEAGERLAGGASLPTVVTPEKMQGMREWLDRLEHKREEGALEAVTVGLRNWNAAADACVLEDRRAQEAAQRGMEARSELRGRMDALKAKARAFGVAESDEANELGGRAEALLYGRPTDVQGAAAAVAQYEAWLRGKAKRA